MSACYEEWALGVANDAAVVAMIDQLPAAKRQPNLVFSASRLRGAQPGSYRPFADWLSEHWESVKAVCLTHATQTNEPGRLAVLLPALAAIPGPLALIEVGASAGLCLYPDRYSYHYLDDSGRERMLDPADGRSLVLLDCEAAGAVPIPDRLPEVAWRAGIDLNPLDVRNDADVDWLEALIWPEHEGRRARLRAAVEVARREPIDLVRGDLGEQIEALVRRAPSGASVVVFHTAVLAYLDEQSRRDFVKLVSELPVTWLANEGQGVVPGVFERVTELGDMPGSSTEFVLAQDGRPIAFTQPHGRSVRWLG